MGRKASGASDPDGLYNVTVRVRGVRKNVLLGEADRLGCSLSELVLLAVEDFCRGREGVPALADGVRPPEVLDVLRGYLLGESVLQPCGVEVCGRVDCVVGGFVFCEVCGVRVG